MPEALKPEEVNSKTDPSVSKQWDDDAPVDTKLEDFYAIADGLKVCMMGISCPGVGPVSRSMAVAKRSGPDFLFLANNHSRKFEDLKSGNTVTLTFQDSKSADWASITGKATTARNDDPRIKDIWSRGASAWFGDLGDGVHNGTADDPRMTLIEIKPNYISYWKSQVGVVGFLTEVVGANLTGGVAKTGLLRQLTESDISSARSKDSELTS